MKVLILHAPGILKLILLLTIVYFNWHKKFAVDLELILKVKVNTWNTEKTTGEIKRAFKMSYHQNFDCS